MSDYRLFLWADSETKAIRGQNGHLNEGKRIVPIYTYSKQINNRNFFLD
jgi:hypothetical protein